MRSEHPALEDLIARVEGRPTAAHPHLSACPACREEVRRWTAVASGVRLLVERREVPRVRRPRSLALPAGVAALIALGVAGAVVVAMLGRSGAPAGRAPASAALLSVQGCPSRYVAIGSLVRVRGSSLVVTSPPGRPVTVATSRATRVVRLVRGTPAGIPDGASVSVVGRPSGDGAIVAMTIMVWRPSDPAAGTQPSGAVLGAPFAHVAGTVRGTPGGILVVTTTGGSRVRVATNPLTRVVLNENVTARDLRPGMPVAAVGTIASSGILATLVAQSDASGPAAILVGGTMLQPRAGCDPAALASDALAGGAVQ